MRIYSLIFFSLLTLFSYQVQAQHRGPNIIVILADDLGIGDLSCYNGKNVHTPNIDALAKMGIQYTSFYANSTVCSPSRAALLTGKYPDRVGVPGVIRQDSSDNWGYLDPSATLLPQRLHEAGYRTAAIGKWHLGYVSPNLPNDKGFDYFKGFLGDMMDDYYTHLRGGKNWMRENKEVIQPEGHATDLFTNWALDYIRNNQKNGEPFFLYLAYNAPHFPIQPPHDYEQKVAKREKGLTEARIKNIALVEHMDHCIGKLVNQLREMGQLENTLIVFTSDNGGSLPHAQSNGLLRGGKQDFYEGGIRVPFIAAWKNKLPAGKKSAEVDLLMDLFPTVCEVAGLKDFPELDGRSFYKSVLNAGNDHSNRTLFWMRKEGGNYGGGTYYAARKGFYKILQQNPKDTFHYFDLKSDPFEKREILKKDAIFGELEKALKAHQDDISLPGCHPG